MDFLTTQHKARTDYTWIPLPLPNPISRRFCEKPGKTGIDSVRKDLCPQGLPMLTKCFLQLSLNYTSVRRSAIEADCC